MGLEAATSGASNRQKIVRRGSHDILQGGWLSIPSRENIEGSYNESFSFENDIQVKYSGFPLVRDMMLSEATRTAALESDGYKQMSYTKSTDGWFRTLFVFEGRAMDRTGWALAIVTLNAIVWTVIAENFLPESNRDALEPYENFFSLVLSTTLAFLLVFRLNRSNIQFWISRERWGSIVALGRSITSGVITHGSHDMNTCYNVIRWMSAFVIATMYFLRGIKKLIPETFAGILTKGEVETLQKARHPPIYAADVTRMYLHELFEITESTPVSVAQYRAQQLIFIEQQLNSLMNDLGAMERIKATPLPLVYVTHLRTWLMLFLLSMPFVWQPSLHYATIPVVFMTAFAMLGLEGAAQEMEAPFTKDRTNHLNMDAYCLLMLSNIQQQITDDANRKKKAAAIATLNFETSKHMRDLIERPPQPDENNFEDSFASIETLDC
ncbi:bestrophin, RFP-TM, chloride channel [Nitzschia inconspicua]|uniref:Bestrophin, RFP-TM, chloride channel n=1 Tax=Nitzschia inconspicua TaxID=303405 RepID=A0A9K3PXX5_9STRA|nr:bestrophin, RFP-TM, chloride channel [Nitzschia inconspicua]KAG7361214.1 bestrophin, RFP-TM, chloride channel [Nitzschia inconspicua]